MLAGAHAIVRQLMQRYVLPQACLFCAGARARDGICESCRTNLPGLSTGRCPVCADISPQASRCGRCLAEPPEFSRVVTATSFGFPTDAAIRRLKYARQLALVQPLAMLLVERLRGETMPDLIVPMPLSVQRLRERGFNQALELARVVSSALEVTLEARRCVRVRDTAPQAALPWQERRRNVRGAFQWQGQIVGARVAVIDDVLTTGATLEELARTLKRAGAREVWGWVVARTERP
jgi:ComF family protein